MKTKLYKRILILLFLNFQTVFLFAQKNTAEYSNDVALKWFDLELLLIRDTPGFSPPVAARAIGYTGLSLYESVVNGMPEYRSLTGILNEFKNVPKIDKSKAYNWEIAANVAMAQTISYFFPNTSKDYLARIENQKLFLIDKYKGGSDVDVVKRSIKYGEDVARAIFEYSKSDGGHEAYRNTNHQSYTSPVGSCYWIPLPDQVALLPQWGHNRTFVAGSAEHSIPEPPKCENGLTSIFYAQALEVYTVGKNLTAEQKEIATFWSDDAQKTFTPPGHGISITNQIVKKEKINLAKAAEIFCKIGIAESDAFVLCWKCKFMHNFVRPISYIRTTIDGKWNTFLTTPPFPEYTSGHASVSGAVAQVLSDFFGFNYAFTDDSHKDRGLKARSFESFFDFANEAAISRLYGGIHYRNSNEQGLKNGKRIGKVVCALPIQTS